MLIWILIIIFTFGFSGLFYFLCQNLYLLPVWLICGFLASVIIVFSFTYIFLLIGQKTSPTGKFKRFYIHQFALFALNIMHIHLKVEGEENLPEDKNQRYIVCGNHKSLLDIVVMYAAVKTPLGFVSKEENYHIHPLAVAMNCLGCVPMNRENDREAAKDMIRAIKRVKSGLSMCIFPEGGIKDRGTNYMVEKKPGAYKLATKTDSWIIPVAITNNQLLQYNSFKKRTDVTVRFLKPLKKEEYESMTTIEISDYVFDVVNENIKDILEKKQTISK